MKKIWNSVFIQKLGHWNSVINFTQWKVQCYMSPLNGILFYGTSKNKFCPKTRWSLSELGRDVSLFAPVCVLIWKSDDIKYVMLIIIMFHIFCIFIKLWRHDECSIFEPGKSFFIHEHRYRNKLKYEQKKTNTYLVV